MRPFKGFAIAHPSEVAIVECEPKRIAEGGKRSFGSIGLGSLQGEVMRLSWCKAPGFATAAALAHDGASAGSHGNPDLCNVCR